MRSDAMNGVSGVLIERARKDAGLTQNALAHLVGTSRPTLSAYEHGRKSPTLDTADRIVEATGFGLELTHRIEWTRIHGARGQVHHVPNHFSRLTVSDAFALFEAPSHLDWSRANRLVDLADVRQRQRWYEVVIREGGADDIARYIDGALLIDVWPQMVVPRILRASWGDLIERSIGEKRG